MEKVIHDSTGKKAEENILCQKDQKIEMIEGCWRKQKNCIENQGHNQEEDLKIGMKEEEHQDLKEDTEEDKRKIRRKISRKKWKIRIEKKKK